MATKQPSKKSAPTQTSLKKASTKAPTVKTVAAKGAAKKAAPAKSAALRKTAQKTVAKTSAKRAVKTKRTATKAPAIKSTDRKYSPAASKQVEREMREMKQGKLKSGSTGQTITNPKQAIAIALSEARRAGKKVPPNPNTPAKK